MVTSNTAGANPEPIRVIVVDDDEAVRSVMEVFLAEYDELKLVGTAANGEKAILLCNEARPDVVLMDIKMPVMDDVTATRLIREQHPQIQIIALSTYPDPELVAAAMGAGVYTYLSKNVSTVQIVDAIRAAYKNRSTV